MKSATLQRLALACAILSLVGTVSVPAVAQNKLVPAETNFPTWVAVSHKLEEHPLDPEVNRDAEVAVQEVANSPDFHTPICSTFFSLLNKLSASGYPYQAQIYRLYTLGSAAYRIQTGKTDSYGTNLYAFTSVLKGYKNITLRDANAHDKALEDLLLADIRGKLEERLKKDSTCR